MVHASTKGACPSYFVAALVIPNKAKAEGLKQGAISFKEEVEIVGHHSSTKSRVSCSCALYVVVF